MSGFSEGQAVQVALPFDFKYYENTYNQVWIAGSGYLSFNNDTPSWPWQGQVPAPSAPNEVIAPYWAPFDLSETGPLNRVYYLAGGTTPNRFFAVEWHQVEFFGDTFTFEAILYENGDILFQYDAMSFGVACGAAGIEDSTGLDGLNYLPFCDSAPSDQAVRFFRPPPSARVRMDPRQAGRFTSPGAMDAMQFTVTNTGELGADTYDLTTASTWPVSLFAADGTTPLVDTDSDGVPDTGSVAQGDSVVITAEVETPAGAAAGDYNVISLTAQSSVDGTKQKTVQAQTSVPGPFAQVFQDQDDGAMSLLLARQDGQSTVKATADGRFGSDPTVAELHSSFAYLWTLPRSIGGGIAVQEIEYAILDREGGLVRAAAKLEDHSGAAIDTYDTFPVVAQAPSGVIGVAWVRELWNSATFQVNDNVYLALLDPGGQLIAGPINLTGNDLWGDWGDLNVPFFFEPRIAATGDDRFVLAWHRFHEETGAWVDDIYVAVRDAAGGVVTPVTRFTTDPGAGEGYYSPGLSPLRPDRVLITYAGDTVGDLYYSVLDSGASPVFPITSLTSEGSSPWDSRADAAELSNGNIVVAWQSWEGALAYLRYAVLNPSFGLLQAPTILSGSPAAEGDGFPSVAATGTQAALTWMDDPFAGDSRHLYYALVGGSGDVTTPPMIFWSSQLGVVASFSGYGNTTYHPWALYLPLVTR